MTYRKSSDILVTGNALWNTWRRDYADVQAFEPDLHAVDLHQAHLRGIDFHEADLTEADLQHADLRGADLQAADLRHANLRGADLSDAHLEYARLRGADLREAKLCRAHLQRADLNTADLRGADLSGADLKKATLDQALFTDVHASTEALKEVDHEKRLKTPPEPVSATIRDAVAVEPLVSCIFRMSHPQFSQVGQMASCPTSTIL